MSTIAMSAVGSSRAGMASAVLNAMRQIGQVFGVAVLGALVYAHVPAGNVGQRPGPPQASLFVAGLHHALWVSGLALLAAAALAALLLNRNAAQATEACNYRRRDRGADHLTASGARPEPGDPMQRRHPGGVSSWLSPVATRPSVPLNRWVSQRRDV